MFDKVSNWLDNVLMQDISKDVVAFCFNLYDDGDNDWSMELIGAARFDTDDEDWPCYEVTDFGTRKENLVWNKTAQWDEVLDEMVAVLKEYLQKGKYAEVLKSKSGVGIGFVDGNIEILYP